ncbi:MAG: HAD-IA family hydrolase [Dehalococcoidales bacterium]|nr:HAD-IA family hydrolase [Dehalococcoidales bacterium]
MKYRAVIFDLFGTLVDNFSRREYESVLVEMASALGVPRDGFIRLWFDTDERRTLGIISSPDGSIEHVCRELRLSPEEPQRKQAARLRSDYTRRAIVPRPDAVEVLSHLKSAGYRTGLISDCSSETPIVWKDTAFASLFDVTVFSSSVGMKKPDPRIYLLATEQLAVRPEECLYIGDGSNHELTGAAGVGMHPVLIRVPYEDTPDAARINEEEWDGPRVSSLTEVLTLLE